ISNKTKAQSTSSVASSNLSNSRANATFTQFFYKNDQTDNTIMYCKICIQELDELDKINAEPYPYIKSRSSTENLVKHLYEKHRITSKNYNRYLDDNKELPKQAQCLRDAQMQIDLSNIIQSDAEDEIVNPLEVLTMLSLATSLRNKSDAASKWEGEKLLKLCLTTEEQEYISVFILNQILSLFEEITRHICGSKYLTLNLVYSYIRTLKNKFAPKSENSESYEAWITLIYSSEDSDTSNNSSFSSNNEADIPSAENHQQW
ncbi:14217_t:CDS:2, partial [Cetraspora pellucida]